MDTTSITSIPEAELWLHEPKLKLDLDEAIDWMEHYITVHPNPSLTFGRVLYKVFQCDLHALSDSVKSEVIEQLKRVFKTNSVEEFGDSTFDYRELVSLPGYYSLRLTKHIKAVVKIHDKQMYFLVLCNEQIPEAFVPDPKVWNEVTSYSLQHNHDIPTKFSVVSWRSWLETCPKCKLAAREIADLFRLATPLYVEMLSSIPHFKSWGQEVKSWSSYISSRKAEAQFFVAESCGVFIPLSGHEKPDSKMEEVLRAWQTVHPGQLPDYTRD